MRLRRSGLFLAEILVAAGLLTAAVSAMMSVASAGIGGTQRTVDNSDAVRSAMLALEAIRADTRSMVVQEARDVAILGGGKGLRVLVPARTVDGDPWSFDGQVVKWELAPVNGSPGVYALMRTAGGEQRALPGCWLRDLRVKLLAPGTLGTGRYLDVSVTAVGAPGAADAVTLSFLAPVRAVGKL